MNWKRWLPKKAYVFGVVAAIFLTSIAVGPAFWLRSFCSIEQSNNNRAYHVTEGRERTEQANKQAAKQNISGTVITNSAGTTSNKITSSKTTDYPAQEPHTFWHRFFCEVNGADYVLAVFTIILALSTIWLAVVTLQAVSLAREEFLTTHRPRIRVRAIGFEDDPAPVKTTNFQMALSCVNIGGSKCEIVSVKYYASEIQYSDRPKISKGQRAKKMGLVPPIILRPGEPKTFSSETLTLPHTCAVSGFDFFGFVTYRDVMEIERLTGFWARYIPRDDRFDIPESPDYNYEY